MRKKTSIIASLFLVTITAFIMVSCDGGTSHNNNLPTSNTAHVSGDEVSIPIIDTKWSFTDEMHYNYVLDIHDLSRNGESVKADVIKNGIVIGHILIKQDAILYRRDGIIALEFDNADEICITFQSDLIKRYHPSMRFVKWDFNEGYLYVDRDALMSEDSSKRIPIKQIK